MISCLQEQCLRDLILVYKLFSNWLIYICKVANIVQAIRMSVHGSRGSGTWGLLREEKNFFFLVHYMFLLGSGSLVHR
jgi:hypothetical protein